MSDAEVRSELPGTFYRSPAPGAPPFVREGQVVNADTVIGVIELMKQFNDVTAGVAGVLHAFSVNDGDAVDADMTLAFIATSGS